MKKLSKKLGYLVGIVVVSVVLGVSLQFVKAWTEPAQLPPNGNVGAPINTGGTMQIKNGTLGASAGGNFGIITSGSIGLLISNAVTSYGVYDQGPKSFFGGNVGIGVSNPTQKLDVNGYIKGTGVCIGNDCRASWPASSTDVLEFNNTLPSSTVCSGKTLNPQSLTYSGGKIGWLYEHSEQANCNVVMGINYSGVITTAYQRAYYGSGGWGSCSTSTSDNCVDEGGGA